MKPSDNPFRSECIDAIDYVPWGTTWEALEKRLRETKFRCAIVGPHGTGKTTLMLSLLNRDIEGCPGTRFWVKVEADRSNLATVRSLIRKQPGLLMVDGYDLLPWRDRLAVLHRPDPVLVTSHRRTALPTLIKTHSDPKLLRELTAKLLGSTAELPDDLPQRLSSQRGNVREVFRGLYDHCGRA